MVISDSSGSFRGISRRVIDGVRDAVADRPVAALAAERDACLLDILAALAKHRAAR